MVRVLLALLLIAILSACSSGTPAQPPTESQPVDSEQDVLTIERDTEYGPGPFDLPDTKAGLSGLSSYAANLVITFDGTRDGNAEKWSKAYAMVAMNNPQARQWTIEKSGDASDTSSVFMAELNGLDYERRGDGFCTATVIPEENALADRLEPASFLTAVFGADEAGNETVNGTEANHYTFDQRALGENGLTESTGELWVAAQGSYVVKYLLTRKGNADYFGEGIEGTTTLDYELTGVGQPVTIALPDDCPPGLVDAPLLTDATEVSNS